MATSGAQPGNKNAAKAKAWEGAIKRAIARFAQGDLSAGLDTLASKLVNAASNGDQWALKEVGDRLDGKPAQAIVGGGEDSEPIRIAEILIRAVDASRDRPPEEGE